MEKISPLLCGQGEPDSNPSGFRNQIRPDEEDQIAHRSEPSFKPARGKHHLSKAHQQVVADTAGSNAAAVASNNWRQNVSRLSSSFSSLIRFSLSGRSPYIRVTNSAAKGTLVTKTRYV